MPDTEVFSDVTSVQYQSWKYHRQLRDHQEHQTISYERKFKNADKQLLKDSIEMLVRRHDSLRACFRETNGALKQYLISFDESTFTTDYFDLNHEENPGEFIIGITSGYKSALRKMDEAPLFRSAIFRLSTDVYHLFILIHHIICDAWSISIIERELNSIYTSLCNHNPVPLPPLKMQIGDYAVWQKEWLAKNREKVRKFWSVKLNDVKAEYHPERRLRISYPSAAKNTAGKFGRNYQEDELEIILNTSKTASYRYGIDLTLYSGLAKLASRCGSITPAVIIASLKILFHQVAGKEKILISMPVSDRHNVNTDSIIGYLVGTIYVYRAVSPEISLKDHVRSNYIEILESIRYLIYDHDEVALDGRFIRANCDLFFNYINNGTVIGNELMSGLPEGLHQPEETEYFALSHTVDEYQNGLVCEWKYNVDLFSPETIEYLSKMHRKLLRTMCSEPDSDVRELIEKVFSRPSGS